MRGYSWGGAPYASMSHAGSTEAGPTMRVLLKPAVEGTFESISALSCGSIAGAVKLDAVVNLQQTLKATPSSLVRKPYLKVAVSTLDEMRFDWIC